MEVFKSQPWSRDACFSSFWAHFNAVEKWKCDHARMVTLSCRLAREKNKHQRGPASTCKRTAIPSRAQVKVPYTSKHSQARSNEEHKCEHTKMNSEPVADDMEEMSEEMVEFFRKTIEHKRNRAAERAEREQRGSDQRGETAKHWIQLPDDEYISADKIGVYGVQKRTFAAPDEAQRNCLRRENARLAYGSSAERILAMETLIDMRFEQEYARKRPPLWPNIPLKF